MSDRAAEFSCDRPLSDKVDDCLNRSAFAERISHILQEMPQGTAIVLGIHGPWGDGKTTVLNLVRNSLSDNKSIIVRDFNPWRLANGDALFRGFFSILAEALETSLATRSEQFSKSISSFARFLRLFTRFASKFHKVAETADDLLAKLGDAATHNDTVAIEALRGRLVGHLSRSDMRIVVLIDDIDRLDNAETHALFRMVKACADFPNVCYVLAFDDSAVASALGAQYGSHDGSSGRSFLEKIIQLPLTLPLAQREDLRRLCFAEVERALSYALIDLSDDQKSEFIIGFERGAMPRLKTPRAAKRYGNCLMFALPVLKDEVSIVDLLLVEAVHAFFPEIYNVVRSNHEEFSGVDSERPSGHTEVPRHHQLLAPVLENLDAEEREGAMSLLANLFPRLSQTFGNAIYREDSAEEWSVARRICAPAYCPRYFTYSIPYSDVSVAAINVVIDSARSGDATLVESRLSPLLVGQKARRVIEELRSYEETLDEVAAETLAKSLSRLGAMIPNPAGIFAFAEPPAQAAILISHLLRRIAERSRRIAAAKRILESAEPVWFAVECARWLHVTNKPETQDQNTLDAEGLNEVRVSLLPRIKAMATTGAPLFDPNVRQEITQLFEWANSEGRDPVQEHLLRVFEADPSQVSQFLKSMAPMAVGMRDAMARFGDLEDEAVKSIARLIDLDILARLIRQHCPGDFDNPSWFPDSRRSADRQLAEQFIVVYQKLQSSG